MMQSENFTPSWPFNSLMDLEGFGLNMDVHFDGSSFATREESCFSTMLSDAIFPYPAYGYDDRLQKVFPCHAVTAMFPQRQDVWSPCRLSEASVCMTTARSMPGLGEAMMGIDNQLTLFHLLSAYGEAKEKNQTELAEVVLRRVSEKGRFAYFASNSAILEAMPNDIDVLHIVDFDIRVGIQWPPLIEAMAMQHKTLRLTSIRWEHFGHSPWRFQDTKETKKRGGSQEWLAFNCMVGLPHMGKRKNRKLVNKFLDIAKQVLATNRGIITLGDGDACEKLKDSSGFGAFFNGQLTHYRAIIESMESDIAKHLVQARIAMECLFIWPNINAQAWFQKWEHMNETCRFIDISRWGRHWKV
ncbi:hypothetical protein F3Y22_tig00110656pilonHSYRG00016 [Hibiscus syriacus]|uniref:Uncharacterized protein n=1 Tax=Hibiscus syriacus TaxID=106335 RepID=A0A6A3A014_HIBSY|nr:hypothetical protein F3Y22_tig00110656pilonHSYRG00016 [Hibiscus syriacus]